MPVLDNAECISKNLDQVLLLAAAEESFCQAATVIHPALKSVTDSINRSISLFPQGNLMTGLHLLEEAMAAHNRYMESLK